MDRRGFLGCLCAAGGASLGLPAAAGAEEEHVRREFKAVLVDTKRCTGCRNCEGACATQNKLPKPDITDKSVFAEKRDTTPSEWTIVNRFETDRGIFYVKKQCMHCNQPACATACPTKALIKTEDGPVIWRADKCMGRLHIVKYVFYYMNILLSYYQIILIPG